MSQLTTVAVTATAPSRLIVTLELFRPDARKLRVPLTGPRVDAVKVTLAVAAVGEVVPLAEDVQSPGSVIVVGVPIAALRPLPVIPVTERVTVSLFLKVFVPLPARVTPSATSFVVVEPRQTDGPKLRLLALKGTAPSPSPTALSAEATPAEPTTSATTAKGTASRRVNFRMGKPL